MFRHKMFVLLCVFAAVLSIASIVSAGVTEVTLNPTATVSPGKTMLTVYGTFTCTPGQSLAILDVHAIQQRGNRQTTGRSLSYHDPYVNPPMPVIDCTGSPMNWEAVIGSSGLWQPGPVSVVVRVSVCTMVPDPWGGTTVDCEYGSHESMTIDGRIHAN